MIALDARLRIEPSEVEITGPYTSYLAVRPIPNQWERWIGTDNGYRVFVRPIKPADEHLYGAFVVGSAGEDPLPLPHAAQGILTQIHRPLHADRLFARHGFRRAQQGQQEELLGVARLAADPDYVTGEYAIIVRSDLKGTGIGWALMRHLIRYAEKEGLRELVGDVLASNQRMLEMCRGLGFAITVDAEDGSIRKVRLKLPTTLRGAAPLADQPVS